MRFVTLITLMSAVILTGCAAPVAVATKSPVYGGKLDEPKSEPKLQSESVVDGRVMWKWDREYTRDIQLRNPRNGFGKDVWHEYLLEVRIKSGDHEEKVDLRVTEEVHNSTKEFDGVKVKRSLYSDGSRSYELVTDKK